MGGVTAFFAVIGIVTFVLRRNNPTDFIQAVPMVMVTPFDQDFLEAAQDTGNSTDQRPLAAEEAGSETPIPFPISQPMSHPVGLSAKELARLRAEVHTQQSYNSRGATRRVSQPTFSPAPVAGTGGAALPYETQRLHSEVESLRREMERLRGGGLGITAPPSYTEGNV